MAEPHTTEDAPRHPRLSRDRRLPTSIIILAFVFVAGIGYVAGMLNSTVLTDKFAELTGTKEIDLSSVQETYRVLAQEFDGDLDQKALIEGANKGLVDAADDQYTVFMNSEESTAFDDSLSGNIGGGIGVEIGLRNDIPTVLRVLQGNSAEKAGIQVNDIISKVNDESVEGKPLNDVVGTIRGDVDTTVKLTIIRNNEEKEFNVTRAKVNNPSAYGEVKNGIGILTVSRFDNDTGSLARAAASSFKQQGVKGVVVDLRGNGGGYVTAAQEVGGIWLDKQIVATERRGGKVTEKLLSKGSPILNGVPTTILVNESSASASEIVAGALHDHKVATLIGQTTFGKGSVQKLVDLSDSAMLKVTIARWYTPNGLNISEKGIAPDTAVTRSAEDFNTGKDPQLDAALASF